jgi:cytochrome oxidase assembly protein ShyY1
MVRASGQLQQLFLLDNQIRQGIVGHHVLGLLVTDYGPLLLNLGWQSAHAPRPTLNNFPSVMTVSGLAVYPEVGLMLAPAKDDPAWPGLMQQIDIPLLRQQLGSDLADFMIVADKPAGGLASVHAAPEDKTPMHIGYALQWLLIAAACLGVCFFACRGDHNDAQ